jgi:hypothetical protein
MKRSLMSLSLVVVLLSPLVGSQGVQADSLLPPVHREQALWCSNMPDAQIAGRQPGSACSVPIVAIDSFSGGLGVLSPLYRRGSTHHWTSQSDSDLTENVINVTGYLYWKVDGSWQHEFTCDDPRNNSQRAVCRTYGPGGSGQTMKSEGFHYFHTTGYVDDAFWSAHINWTS